jgi:hypothetical protein
MAASTDRKPLGTLNFKTRSLFDHQFGSVVEKLTYCARGHEFDPRTGQIFVRMNMFVCIGSGLFHVRVVSGTIKKNITFSFFHGCRKRRLKD